MSCVRTVREGGRDVTFKRFPRDIPKDRRGYFSDMCVLWEMLITFSRGISNYVTLCEKELKDPLTLSPFDSPRCHLRTLFAQVCIYENKTMFVDYIIFF